MAYYSYQSIRPVVDPSAYVHEAATLIGEVVVGAHCFIGAGAVLRGDFGSIFVGEGSNIQETCVVHSFPNRSVEIGRNAHIGHGAVLHGCILEDNCLIGMNAVVMDGARIGANSIIGALSFVKEGCEIAQNVLAFGNPVREIRPLSAEERAWKVQGTQIYQQIATAKEIEPCTPLLPGDEQNTQRSEFSHHRPLNDQ